MQFTKSKSMQKTGHRLIPGGAHTYAKGDDQYPVNAPAYLTHGKGCRVWDVDGNCFIEYGMGLRSVALGHAYEPVVQAATEALAHGLNFTRPAAIEIEYAERLLAHYPAMDMVKFAKNGSDVTTAAVKLARACTGRDKVAICADQPFFSTDDWFIGSTAMNAGIPAAIRDLTLKFNYNNLDSLQALFDQHPEGIACVIMEAAGSIEPVPGYLQAVKQLCKQNGALFILDEIITGFRWHVGGAQHVYDIEPDLATLGKAVANGFSVSALLGKREFMQRGGLNTEQERVFLLSTTHGAETHSLAAALATLGVYENDDVTGVLMRQGRKLAEGAQAAASAAGISDYFQVLGRPCNLIFATLDQKRERSQVFRALFMQEMIARGVLAPSFVISYSHDDAALEQTLTALEGALGIYARALQDGAERFLHGRPVKPVFRKFN